MLFILTKHQTPEKNPGLMEKSAVYALIFRVFTHRKSEQIY